MTAGTVLAADLAEGMIVSVGDPERPGMRYACRIHRILMRRNGSVFIWGTVLHGPDEGYLAQIFSPGHVRMGVLSEHFGVCRECGGLSPCSEEAIDYEASVLLAEADPFETLMRENGIRGYSR